MTVSTGEAEQDRPPCRVLVADDAIEMQLSLRLALEEARFAVTCVDSGRRALAALRDGTYDIAVLDLWMPDGDGLSVLKAIRREQPGLRIFVVTGGGPRMPLEAAALIANVWGAERVLVKPFDERELVEAMGNGRSGPAAPVEQGTP